MFYNCFDGQVRELGKKSSGGPGVYEGDSLIMRVNLSSYRVDWLVNQKIAATSTISSNLRNKDLYLFVTMSDKDDEVNFIV